MRVTPRLLFFAGMLLIFVSAFSQRNLEEEDQKLKAPIVKSVPEQETEP